MKEKNPMVTLILNLCLSGLGHVYASNGERWGLLAANLICAIFTALFCFPVIGNIIIAIFALADSFNVTHQFNNKLKNDSKLE